MKVEFIIDDEVYDLIKATLPEGVSIDVASKVCLMGFATSNLNEKKIFEAIGRMQFRKTLKNAISYLRTKNTNLRIKKLQDFLDEQVAKNPEEKRIYFQKYYQENKEKFYVKKCQRKNN